MANKMPTTKGMRVLKKGIFENTFVIWALKLKKNPVWL
jgi:hypothetical protein